MKPQFCQKCTDNQRKAGEALGLFNEAAGELLDYEALLRDVHGVLTRKQEAMQLSPDDTMVLARIRVALEHAGERKCVENGIREIIATT